MPIPIEIKIQVEPLDNLQDALNKIITLLEAYEANINTALERIDELYKRTDDLSNHLHYTANQVAGKTDARIVDLMIKAALVTEKE